MAAAIDAITRNKRNYMLQPTVFRDQLRPADCRTPVGRHGAARCNGYALNTLRSALDFIVRTPVEHIDINRGYLAKMTAHEFAEERKLTAQVLAFFVSVRERCGLAPDIVESFENS